MAQDHQEMSELKSQAFVISSEHNREFKEGKNKIELWTLKRPSNTISRIHLNSLNVSVILISLSNDYFLS